MKRVLVILATIAGAALAAPLAQAPVTVSACSFGAFGHSGFEQHFEDAEIVAIGTFTDTTRNVASLEVEEVLHGDPGGDILEVNNHIFGIGADCSLLLDDDSPGHRFETGERVLIFLEGDQFDVADWQPTHWGYGVLQIRGDALIAADVNDPLTIDEVRAAVDEVDDETAADLDYEYGPECDFLPLDRAHLPEYARLSTLIVRGTAKPSEGETATVEVDEYLKGEHSGETLAVNNNHLYDPRGTCDPTLDPVPMFREQRDVVLFLRPDEFIDEAGFRAVAWNHGVLALRDGLAVRYPGIGLLSELRAQRGLDAPTATAEPTPDHASATKVVPISTAVPQDEDQATPRADADRTGSSDWMWWTGAFALTAVGGGAGIGAWRWRRR